MFFFIITDKTRVKGIHKYCCRCYNTDKLKDTTGGSKSSHTLGGEGKGNTQGEGRGERRFGKDNGSPLISEFVVFVKLHTELQMINLDVVQNDSNRFEKEIQRGQVCKQTTLMFSSAK